MTGPVIPTKDRSIHSGFPLSECITSGIRYGLSGSGTGAGPEPVSESEPLNPGPDGLTRDLRIEAGKIPYPRVVYDRYGSALTNG